MPALRKKNTILHFFKFDSTSACEKINRYTRDWPFLFHACGKNGGIRFKVGIFSQPTPNFRSQ